MRVNTYNNDHNQIMLNIYINLYYTCNESKYIKLYGETDVNIALFFLSAGKFESAISAKNEMMFNQAKEFAISALGEESAKEIFPLFEKKFMDSKKE